MSSIRTTSTATVFKSIHPRPRIAQLTTERFEKEGSDMFYNNIPQKKLSDVWAWKVTGDTKQPDLPNPQEAAKIAPSVKIDLDKLRKRSEYDEKESTLLSTWMGHASFFVQVDGVNVLTDPVFSERASPVAFAGPKRYVPVPCKIEELPRVDIVTISHNHYDHLDTATVQLLHKTFNPIFVVPRGMKSRWFTTLGWQQSNVENRVVELGWYNAIEVAVPSRVDEGSSLSITANQTVSKNDSATATSKPVSEQQQQQQQEQVQRIVQITFCPVQHWTQRGITDRNKELWGSFVVEHYRSKSLNVHSNKFFYDISNNNNNNSNNKGDTQSPSFVARWFHSGDTGYHPKFFKEIGQEFGRHNVHDLSVAASSKYATPESNTTPKKEGDEQEMKKPSSSVADTTNNNDDDSQQQEQNEKEKEQEKEVTEQEKQKSETSSTKPPLFDLALIPIGAYHPRWFLADQHVDPDQAVMILQEIGNAKLALGMHWGTFILTDEPLDEPPKLLKESCAKRGVPDGVFIAPKHGESYTATLRNV